MYNCRQQYSCFGLFGLRQCSVVHVHHSYRSERDFVTHVTNVAPCLSSICMIINTNQTIGGKGRGGNNIQLQIAMQ